MATKKQKTIIHILKGQLELSRGEYEGLLARYEINSSADENFTAAQADDLIGLMRKEQRARKDWAKGGYRGWGKQKYEYLRPRPARMADPKQLRKIEALWRDVARTPTDRALEAFCERLTGTRKLQWLERPQARALLVALQQMRKQ
jgi:hypothetical protein